MDNPERRIREALEETLRLIEQVESPPISTGDVQARLDRVQEHLEAALRMLEGQ